MKKCLLRSIELVIISMLILISHTGCASNDYTCKVVDDQSLNFISEKDNGKIVFIELGDTTYEAQYRSSRQSSFTNDIFDVYEVVDNSANLFKSQIQINSDTGQVTGFISISPYPIIEGIDSMSDTELREIVESMVSDLADFSQYNEFRVSRPQSAASSYHLLWQVQRDLPCNIKVEIYITVEGLIDTFIMTDACPPDLSSSFVSNADRDKLLEKEICNYLGVNSLTGVEYEILSEMLSYHSGMRAVTYTVRIIEDGFVNTILMVIY